MARRYHWPATSIPIPARDGTVAHFDKSHSGASPYFATGGRVVDVTSPSGAKLSYGYESVHYCSANRPGGGGMICTQHRDTYRIATITSSFGYRFNFAYQGDSLIFPEDDGEVPDTSVFQSWSTLTGVSGENLAGRRAAARRRRASATRSSAASPSYIVTDPLGRQTGFRWGSGGRGRRGSRARAAAART